MATGFGSDTQELPGENSWSGVAGTEAWVHRVEKRAQQLRAL